ncbi:integrase [Pseudomonas gingeri]|uniref:integrase n=1 Tax=Pseudomonas gingeri TaxID=117681 RepID=UPI0015A144CF|nr:integrase [Pseudomonas gingeri]NWD04956.1 integrase [Pseudomonas gingeri]NWE31280.1 integrase [Pseudomonas gingeri]NWE56732.1 integrase [Pseudomonas gingeri]NWF05432.1 integrase [Pseudomonas gingeri]
MSLRTGYEFLDDFGPSDNSPHTSAPWLLSDFHQNIWKTKTIQKKANELDWGVHLWNGSLLTDSENGTLLLSLKYLLIIGTNGVNEEFSTLAPVSQNVRLSCTLRLIDYLLINAAKLGIVQYGLAAMDEDDLKGILNQLASSPWSEDSIYLWHERVSAYCNILLSSLLESEARYIFSMHPAMEVVSDDQYEDLKLNIAAADIPRIRAAFMKAGMYYGNRSNGFKISTMILSERIYPDTLRGRKTQKTGLESLSFYPSDVCYKREFPGVRVTTGDSETLQDTLYYQYRYALLNSAELVTLGLPAPANTDIIAEYIPKVAEPSRFRSVPSSNLMKLFRSSLDFHVENGRKILNGFIRVAAHCHAQAINMPLLPEMDFLRIIGPELASFGVQKLGFSTKRRSKNSEPLKGPREVYFQCLRANRGLLELVYVYLGCVQLVVGMIMARRVDELVTLNVEKCLDKTNSWLVFNLAKSTRKTWGLRQRESRPIDAIAVEMIEELLRFQKLLKRLGVIDKLTDLFATPSSHGTNGLLDCSRHLYNRHLDFACDYFESDVTEAGERYYVRQHQLRRFFAIMFFYTNSFGELDTLRWMLGHRDVEHVWRYLSDCLKPKDIRMAGARYLTDLAINERLENYQNLQDLLFGEFGTTNFSVVDENRIEDYLAGMLEEGKARIEPQFFNDEHGKSMKILFIVS